jgi:dUTPase
MPNSPGVIDVGYRGELKVQLFNPGAEEVTIAAGEAVVQVVAPGLQPAEYIYIARDDFLHSEMVPSAFKNDRGDGGFGSTGLQGSSGK